MNVSTSLGGVSGPSQWVGGVGHTPFVDWIFKTTLKCANSHDFGCFLDEEGVANRCVWLKRIYPFMLWSRSYQILIFFVNKILGQNQSNFWHLTIFHVILKRNGLYVGDVFCIHLGSKYADFQEKIFAEISGKKFQTLGIT